MVLKSLKKTLVYSSESSRDLIESEIERISKQTGFSFSRITECILFHTLFPESMNSEIWEVISKHLIDENE